MEDEFDGGMELPDDELMGASAATNDDAGGADEDLDLSDDGEGMLQPPVKAKPKAAKASRLGKLRRAKPAPAPVKKAASARKSAGSKKKLPKKLPKKKGTRKAASKVGTARRAKTGGARKGAGSGKGARKAPARKASARGSKKKKAARRR